MSYVPTAETIHSRLGEDIHTEALTEVDELGTHVIVHLNRCHFLLTPLENPQTRSPRIPSDRWYRLYAQLEGAHSSPYAIYLLTAACLVAEIDVLTRRSDQLSRQSRRAAVREEVARELDAVGPTTTNLLDRACSLSRTAWTDDDPDDDPLTAAASGPVDKLQPVAPVADSAEPAARRRGTTGVANDLVLDELVVAAQSGDRTAVAQLLEAIRPPVARYCRGRLGSIERPSLSADDVAQEVCLAVLAALPNYRVQGRNFLAFVYGVAAHKVIDAHRAMTRGRSDPVADVPDSIASSPGPEQRALRRELSATLRDLLNELPEKQREILVLRVVVGLSAEETAQATGATLGAVRVAQHRGLARLRKTWPAESA